MARSVRWIEKTAQIHGSWTGQAHRLGLGRGRSTQLDFVSWTGIDLFR